MLLQVMYAAQVAVIIALSQGHHELDKIGNCNDNAHLTCFAFTATVLLSCDLLKYLISFQQKHTPLYLMRLRN